MKTEEFLERKEYDKYMQRALEHKKAGRLYRAIFDYTSAKDFTSNKDEKIFISIRLKRLKKLSDPVFFSCIFKNLYGGLMLWDTDRYHPVMDYIFGESRGEN